MLKALAIAALVLCLSLPTAAHAISHGARLATDGCTVLVTKDIDGQRWSVAIVRCGIPFFVTGIVSGLQDLNAEPTFFECQINAIRFDGTNDALTCLVAPACRLENGCPAWSNPFPVTVSDDFLN